MLAGVVRGLRAGCCCGGQDRVKVAGGGDGGTWDLDQD